MMLVVAALIFVGWPGRYPHGARHRAARIQTRSFVESLKSFKVESGRWPASLEELCAVPPSGGEPWLDRLPSDPWGNPYDCRVIGDKPVVRSAGPDGVLDTEDDISSDDP